MDLDTNKHFSMNIINVADCMSHFMNKDIFVAWFKWAAEGLNNMLFSDLSK